MFRPAVLALFLLSFMLTLARGSAAPDARPVYTDPETAGADFAVQGEYLGRAGERQLGCQVIALGDGKFQAVFLPGGLPGDGWDGKTRIRVDGAANGELALFEPAGSAWKARLGGGIMVGENAETKFRLRKVTRRSPTEGLRPPEGAVVLFDGTGTEQWVGAKLSEDRLLLAGSRTKREFTDLSLHLEFRTPFKPHARGQARGNSGVYLLNRYEIQILDSFGLNGLHNECGGLYRQKAPDVNMCYPPLAWQTYDVEFTMARFDGGGSKVRNAVVTVRHNGIVIHDRVELSGPTGGAARRSEVGTAGPISIQNHGNPVMLRNIWLVERSAGSDG